MQQRITGFGASSAWTAAQLRSPADADLLFTRDAGIGLNHLRIRIQPPVTQGAACSTLELATAQAAIARGVTVWATPWSPPAFWKTNNSLNNGGSLLPEHYDDWANCLAGFVSSMAAQGVPISYLSAQNEPTTGTASTNYDSCIYTPDQLTDFIANHLQPALTAAGLTTPIMAPETEGWGATLMTSFSASILGNEAATSAVSIFATHSYAGVAGPIALPAGKELWETEWSELSAPADPGMASALTVATQMYTDLTAGNVSAWHFWWIYPNKNTYDDSALWDFRSQAPAKRLYAMGNYSRFVLPGYSRVLATTTAANKNILVSAYTDDGASKIVIVAINSNTSATPQTFLFDGVSTGSWSAYVTSATENSTSAGTPVPSDSNATSLTTTLEASSVTTLVGSITGPGPAIPVPTTATLYPAAQSAGGCACSEASLGGGPGKWALFGLAGLVGLGASRRRKSRPR